MTSMIGTSGMGAATGMGGNSMTGRNVIPKGYKMGQLQRFTPEQMQLFKQTFGQVGPESFLGKLAGGDQSMFDQLEAPAMQQFNQLMGGIGSRFSGMGAGARRSSGFQNTASQAASDFAQQLQAQRMGIQRQALQDMMGITQGLLGQQPFENFLAPKQKPFWQELLAGISPGFGSGIGQAGGLAAMKKLGLLG